VDATQKLELNAYIERLIDSKGHDAEARAAVCDFGLGIRQGSPVSFNAAVTKPGDTVLGHTPEHGSVLVGDDKPETKEYSRGEVIERIGYYKIWRMRRWICMSHFWKSTLGTESDTELAQEWALAIDKKGTPQWFGERARKPVFSFHLTRALLVLVSRNIFVESWGRDEGKRHPGGFIVEITVDASGKH
jgi:hypothetical protein